MAAASQKQINRTTSNSNLNVLSQQSIESIAHPLDKLKPRKNGYVASDYTEQHSTQYKQQNNNYKVRDSKSIANGVERRNSTDNNLRATIFKKANEASTLKYTNDQRRQSFDQSISSDTPRSLAAKQPSLFDKHPKMVPSMSKHKILNALQYRSTNNLNSIEKLDKIHTRQNSLERNLPAHKLDKQRPPNPQVFKAPPTNEQFDNRLKQIEEKIRKHKLNIKTYANHSEKLKTTNSMGTFMDVSMANKKKLLPSQSEPAVAKKNRLDLFRTKSAYNAIEHQQAAINGNGTSCDFGRCFTIPSDSVGDGDFGNSFNRYHRHSNTNFGVIKATDLYKLRSSELIS